LRSEIGLLAAEARGSVQSGRGAARDFAGGRIDPLTNGRAGVEDRVRRSGQRPRGSGMLSAATRRAMAAALPPNIQRIPMPINAAEMGFSRAASPRS